VVVVVVTVSAGLAIPQPFAKRMDMMRNIDKSSDLLIFHDQHPSDVPLFKLELLVL
jgi:hypothetical protein